MPTTDNPTILSRLALEERERRELKPYGMQASQSRGRRHVETEHPYRTAYQRDRDRIVHCSAFRRLEYKTQVFANNAGDEYRTRLTHTMEVAQIARTAARALGLNEDLTEAIALAHDLGHGPFGHTGEDALDELMREHGGFEHNRHALRIVDELERKYPDFPGLNLSDEVRASLLKHDKVDGLLPHLEAQVVDAADRIAYNTHDVDDGLASGLIREEQLHEVALWRDAFEAVSSRHPSLDAPTRRYHTVRALIDRSVSDLLEASAARIEDDAPGDAQEARQRGVRLVAPSPETAAMQAELSRFLFQNFYNHHEIMRMRRKAHRFVAAMWRECVAAPELLPPRWKAWAQEVGAERAACDYLAGMTDREALSTYRRLFDADA